MRNRRRSGNAIEGEGAGSGADWLPNFPRVLPAPSAVRAAPTCTCLTVYQAQATAYRAALRGLLGAKSTVQAQSRRLRQVTSPERSRPASRSVPSQKSSAEVPRTASP
jgi:hypothetical protein